MAGQHPPVDPRLDLLLTGYNAIIRSVPTEPTYMQQSDPVLEPHELTPAIALMDRLATDIKADREREAQREGAGAP